MWEACGFVVFSKGTSGIFQKGRFGIDAAVNATIRALSKQAPALNSAVVLALPHRLTVSNKHFGNHSYVCDVQSCERADRSLCNSDRWLSYVSDQTENAAKLFDFI